MCELFEPLKPCLHDLFEQTRAFFLLFQFAKVDGINRFGSLCLWSAEGATEGSCPQCACCFVCCSVEVRCSASLSHVSFSFPQSIPLYTTATSYPWYHTISPITLSLPARALEEKGGVPESQRYYSYRYAIHRAGVFHRWENASDLVDVEGEDVTMEDSQGGEKMVTEEERRHKVPLRLLVTRESYTINDVLGVTTGPPDIDHIRVPTRPAYTSAAAMHSRDSSQNQLSHPNMQGAQGNQGVSPKSAASRKKAVGFAPAPPPYHHHAQANNTPKATVHLNSTDGLVVVSAFLPVILHRSNEGVWTADWDYEVLLSMQTHLRVTRVGVVKWRGWHGNIGNDGSPVAGVPVNERALVEECLQPFNCVPVWVEPKLFGEM